MLLNEHARKALRYERAFKVGTVYDTLVLILHGVRKAIIKEMDTANKAVLDVATGTGNLAVDLSQSAEKVVGIDLSSEMLEIAKKEKEKRQSDLSVDGCQQNGFQ